MARRRQIYEGKAKILYEGPEPGTIIQYFKDDATAFNAQKKGTISGKGVLNNRISEHIFTLLGQIGVDLVQGFGIHKPCLLQDILAMAPSRLSKQVARPKGHTE